jgi:hypothetical protein
MIVVMEFIGAPPKVGASQQLSDCSVQESEKLITVLVYRSSGFST